MERNFTLVGLAFVLSAQVMAQPTIDLANNRPFSGAEYGVENRNSWTWEGPSGADANYAFYDLFSTGSRVYFAHDASITSSSTSVPAANMITTDGGSDTTFWNFAEDGLYQVGAKTSLELLSSYTDPILEIKYPCTFGTTWSDITVATYNSPLGSVSRTGTITGSADAHGALGLSEMSYPNVLRVKVRRDFNETSIFASARRITTTYYFFDESIAWPVLKLTMDSLSVNNGGFTETRSAQWIGGPGGVGMSEVDMDQVTFNPYPNPTTGRVDLGLGQDQLRSVEVFTATGQLVATEVKPITGTFSSVLDLSGLPGGVYHLKVTSTEGRTGSRRVVVE